MTSLANQPSVTSNQPEPLVDLRHDAGPSLSTVAGALQRLARMRVDLFAAQRECQRLGALYAEADRHNVSLVRLYAVLTRLHQAVTLEDVVATIYETLTNVIGTEWFSVYRLDREAQTLEELASIGLPPGRSTTFRANQLSPLTAEAIAQAQVQITPVVAENGNIAVTGPLAAIPLRAASGVLGVIIIFGLLPQKNGLEQVDLELFELLAEHAARGLVHSASLVPEVKS